MFPKVGDVVRLNPDFLKVWFDRDNGYFKEEMWKEDLTVINTFQLDCGVFRINLKSKDYGYILYILSNGESSLSNIFKEYKSIQVFTPANIETKKNNIYCSCSGQKKENWVLGKRFYVCTTCKKEKSLV